MLLEREKRKPLLAPFGPGPSGSSCPARDLDHYLTSTATLISRPCCLRSGAAKVATRHRAEEKIGDRCTKQCVQCEFGQRVEGAQDDVIADPSECKPARPVTAAEHKRSTQNGYEAEEFDPNEVVLKRLLGVPLAEMICEANSAHHNVHASDDGHRERAWVHMDSGSPISQGAIELLQSGTGCSRPH